MFPSPYLIGTWRNVDRASVWRTARLYLEATRREWAKNPLGFFPHFGTLYNFQWRYEGPYKFVSPDNKQILVIAADPADPEPIHNQWDLTDEEYIWGLGTPEARDKFEKSMGWLGLNKIMTNPSRYYMEGKSVPFHWIFYEEIKQYLLGDVSYADTWNTGQYKRRLHKLDQVIGAYSEAGKPFEFPMCNEDEIDTTILYSRSKYYWCIREKIKLFRKINHIAIQYSIGINTWFGKDLIPLVNNKYDSFFCLHSLTNDMLILVSYTLIGVYNNSNNIRALDRSLGTHD
jgi:hypothetical protein